MSYLGEKTSKREKLELKNKDIKKDTKFQIKDAELKKEFADWDQLSNEALIKFEEKL